MKLYTRRRRLSGKAALPHGRYCRRCRHAHIPCSPCPEWSAAYWHSPAKVDLVTVWRSKAYPLTIGRKVADDAMREAVYGPLD